MHAKFKMSYPKKKVYSNIDMFQAGYGIKITILVNCESVPTTTKCNRKQGERGRASKSDTILWVYNRQFGALHVCSILGPHFKRSDVL